MCASLKAIMNPVNPYDAASQQMKPAKHTFSQPLETLTNRPVAFVIRSDHGHRREALSLRSLASQCFCTSFLVPVVPMLPMRIRQKHELCFDNARGSGDIPFIEQIVKSPGAGRVCQWQADGKFPCV